MLVNQAATKARRDPGGIEPGHADHHKPSLPTIPVAGEIAIYAPSNSLDDKWQRLTGNSDPPLGTKNAEIRCQPGDHDLKGLGVFDVTKRDDMRCEFVMPVVVMMMVVVIFLMVMIVMVMMHLRRTGMRLVFHVEPKNGVHRRGAARYRNDRRWRFKLCFDSGAGAGRGLFVQKVGLRKDNQIRGANLIREQLVNRTFMVKLFVSRTLRFQRSKVMRHAAIGKRRPVDQRHDAVQHHLVPDIRPVERLNKRLR